MVDEIGGLGGQALGLAGQRIDPRLLGRKPGAVGRHHRILGRGIGRRRIPEFGQPLGHLGIARLHADAGRQRLFGNRLGLELQIGEHRVIECGLVDGTGEIGQDGLACGNLVLHRLVGIIRQAGGRLRPRIGSAGHELAMGCQQDGKTENGKEPGKQTDDGHAAGLSLWVIKGSSEKAPA